MDFEVDAPLVTALPTSLQGVSGMGVELNEKPATFANSPAAGSGSSSSEDAGTTDATDTIGADAPADATDATDTGTETETTSTDGTSTIDITGGSESTTTDETIAGGEQTFPEGFPFDNPEEGK